MAVLRPRRLFRWTSIIPWGVILLIGLFSVYAFPLVRLLVTVSLFWLPVRVRWCFEMRELLTDRLGFVSEWLLAAFTIG